MSYVAIVLILGFLVLVHETGHLLAAQIVGIPVARFSIGFGPPLCAGVWGATEYRVGLIPVGGYVLPRLRSEHEYLRMPLLKRIAFSLGGPAANFLVAIPAFALLNAASGNISLQALVVAPFVQVGSATAQILASLGMLFSRPDAVSGVVGIVTGGSHFAGLDPVRLLLLAGIVDLNLMVLNLLPLPPLDGGKVALDCLERLFPKARRAYVPVMLVGWLFIIGLMVYATAMDVSKLAA
jgi:regulator of sigma E protease